ncbi:MAG: mechanosensitive ion channel family protein [Methanocorpusculum sp.]|nr:mechanosensitive ion channel family protein [Methanocorpusculum sp.]MDE2521875.1 mechanosensitive ion channel family protein [Methanocorpusculum sp.]MDE2524868.1 mechanosensitive ion channel family protein [Methanocorpusculum sp.]
MLELDELFMGGGILLIGISASVIVGIATHFLLRYLHHKSARFLVNAFGYPIAGFILATTIYIAFDTYMPDLLKINTRYYDALLVFLCIWTVYRIGMSTVDHFYPSDHHEPSRAGPILKFTLRVIIWGFGVMMILNTLNINITPLLAGAGIAGIAVALAAQDVLGNIFGGVVLYMDTPFRVGDWVKVSGQFGEVLQIGPRSTRIKTLDSQLMTIPNSKIAGDAVINFSAPQEYMLIRLKIGVAYGSDVELVKKTMKEAVDNVFAKTPYLSHDEPVETNFLSFGDSSLNFELVICAGKPLYYYAAIDAVNSEVDRLFRERNISIPFPQREVRILNMPDKGL